MTSPNTWRLFLGALPKWTMKINTSKKDSLHGKCIDSSPTEMNQALGMPQYKYMYICIPGLEPSKKRPFPLKIRFIWVTGIYIYTIYSIFIYQHLPFGVPIEPLRDGELTPVKRNHLEIFGRSRYNHIYIIFICIYLYMINDIAQKLPNQKIKITRCCTPFSHPLLRDFAGALDISQTQAHTAPLVKTWDVLESMEFPGSLKRWDR